MCIVFFILSVMEIVCVLGVCESFVGVFYECDFLVGVEGFFSCCEFKIQVDCFFGEIDQLVKMIVE